jgi:hypothetical protein
VELCVRSLDSYNKKAGISESTSKETEIPENNELDPNIFECNTRGIYNSIAKQ